LLFAGETHGNEDVIALLSSIYTRVERKPATIDFRVAVVSPETLVEPEAVILTVSAKVVNGVVSAETAVFTPAISWLRVDRRLGLKTLTADLAWAAMLLTKVWAAVMAALSWSTSAWVRPVALPTTPPAAPVVTAAMEAAAALRVSWMAWRLALTLVETWATALALASPLMG